MDGGEEDRRGDDAEQQSGPSLNAICEKCTAEYRAVLKRGGGVPSSVCQNFVSEVRTGMRMMEVSRIFDGMETADDVPTSYFKCAASISGHLTVLSPAAH